MKKIILASKSPRRSQLLTWAEVPFEVIASDSEENYPEGLAASEVAMHIAKQKAISVKRLLWNNNKSIDLNITNSFIHPILAADTIVVLKNKIIGKPQTTEQAIFTLKELSGRIHHVITGVCILYGDKEILFSETTIVEFQLLTDHQIKYYVEHYKPFDKAGAYAIQEWIGVIGIKSIRGDFYNVMGLPVSRVLLELQHHE